MPPVNSIVVETILLPPERRNQGNVDRAVKLLSRMLAAVDEGLKGREYLAGNFSGADIMTGHACTVAATPRRRPLRQAEREGLRRAAERAACDAEGLGDVVARSPDSAA